MKKILLVAALAPFFAFQCDKSITTKCVKGKVIRISCASYVIQVLNNDSVGEDQWKDIADKPDYVQIEIGIKPTQRSQTPYLL